MSPALRHRPDPSAPAPVGGRPVSRLLAPVVVRVGVVVGLLGAICIAGVLGSTRAVDHIVDELAPAAAANEALLQDLTDMDAAVGDYARSGQSAAVVAYREAGQSLPGHQQRVRQFAADDPSLAARVERQEAAAAAWLTQYAEPRVAAPGGPATYQPERYELGQRLFAEVRAAHRATAAEFDRRQRQAVSDAQWRFRATILAVVVLGLLAWLVLHRSRTRLLRELADPLLAMEAVVQRMSQGEEDVRAEVTGPREVRAVAVSLNELADHQARARAVEASIQDELRVLDTAKDDFVSNVSHELRTPLTTINGYLEMVAEEFEDRMAPRHERILEATRRNVARLTTLIDDLLALSRAESRATDLERVDLTQVVRDAVTDVRIPAARRRVRVEVVAPVEPMLVLADRAMLSRAFLNLLTNAVKFSHDDGIVEAVVTSGEQWVEVAVVDRGIGIPAAELDRLGSRFFRASNAVSHQISGTGLGVRIVQTIIDKHAGEVAIESVEGHGTTVTVRLPRQQDPVPDASVPDASEPDPPEPHANA